MLGFGRLTGNYVPRIFQFAVPDGAARLRSREVEEALAEAGYPERLRRGRLLSRSRPTTRMGEAVIGYLQAVGIKSRMRTMERRGLHHRVAREEAPRRDPGHHRRLRQRGHAARALRHQERRLRLRLAARDRRPLRPRRPASSTSRSARRMVHEIQKIIARQGAAIPLFEQAFIWGVGPRVAGAGPGLIPGFSYSAPFEDLRLKN